MSILFATPFWTWRTRSKRSQRHARIDTEAQKRGADGRLMQGKSPCSKLPCAQPLCGSQEPQARRAAPPERQLPAGEGRSRGASQPIGECHGRQCPVPPRMVTGQESQACEIGGGLWSEANVGRAQGDG